MVVDSNFLQRDELRDYLSAAPDNHAVLTDYAAIEAYKGETLKSIFRSMEILTAFPKQVIILKGTQVICGMSGRAEAVQESLVDKTQTRDFSAYCRDLLAAKNGDLSFQQGLLEHGREASAHMDRVLQDMPLLSSGFALMAQEYTLRRIEKFARTRGVVIRIAHEARAECRWTGDTIVREFPQLDGSVEECENARRLSFSLRALHPYIDRQGERRHPENEPRKIAQRYGRREFRDFRDLLRRSDDSG